MILVRLEHLSGVRGFSRRAGFCRRGARAWFAVHALDWDTFRWQGLPAEVFEATGDPMAVALAAHARAMAEATHGRH